MAILDVIPAVLVPRPHSGIFSYQNKNSLAAGTFVEVPFQKRFVPGVVYGVPKKKDKKRALKPLKRALSEASFLPEALMRFLEWEAKATATPLGYLLSLALQPWMLTTRWNNKDLPKTQRTPKITYLPFLNGTDAYRYQQYFLRASRVVRTGGQVLVFVPTLSVQKEVLSVFGTQAVAAPRMQTNKGQELWRKMRRGEPLAVIGLAGARYLPFSRLRLVVLDDASSALWKETRTHPYTDMLSAGRILSAFHGATLLKGGLLPPLEISEPRVKRDLRGKKTVTVVDLKTQYVRRGGIQPFERVIIDLISRKKRARILIYVNRRGSAPVLQCADCGFVFTCTHCDAAVPVFRVPQNRAEHEAEQRRNLLRISASADRPLLQSSANERSELRCRHCGKTFIPPLVCPSCRGFHLEPKGAAIEGLGAVLRKNFPEAWVGELDAHRARQKRNQKEWDQALEGFDGCVILLATSAVFHYPLPPLDLIIVPAADQLLALPDIYAEEEAFGVFERLRSFLKPSGRLLAQTWHPENPVLEHALSGDFSAFMVRELAQRKQFGLPPFRRLAKLTFVHHDNAHAAAESARLVELLQKILAPSRLAPEIIGPYPAYIPRIRGKYRWRVLLKWTPQDEHDLRIEEALWREIPSSWDIDIRPRNIL